MSDLDREIGIEKNNSYISYPDYKSPLGFTLNKVLEEGGRSDLMRVVKSVRPELPPIAIGIMRVGESMEIGKSADLDALSDPNYTNPAIGSMRKSTFNFLVRKGVINLEDKESHVYSISALERNGDTPQKFILKVFGYNSKARKLVVQIFDKNFDRLLSV